MTNEVKKRDISVDLVKMIAIIGVVVIHTCSAGFYHPANSHQFIATAFWRCLTSASVPLFLISSGALMLRPEKEISLKKLWFRNILRLVVAMFFWAMAYKLAALFVGGTFSPATLIHAFKETLIFKHEFHLYYIHIMLLVYAFLPITRLFIKNCEKKDLHYFIAVWFAVGIIYPTVYLFWPITLIQGFPQQWLMNMCYASIGYGIMGYYFTKYKLSLKTCIAYILCGFAAVFGLTCIMSLQNGTLYDHFLGGMTAGVCFLAFGIFGICKYIPDLFDNHPRITATIIYFSKASFCIYLVHVFIIRIFDKLGFVVNIGHPVFMIPLIAICNILISTIIYFVLSKIPVINKWLI